MPGDKLTIGAIGVGPVGTILAASLARAGAEIIVADLPFRIDQIRGNGLQVDWNGELIEQPVSTVDSIQSLRDLKPDCIFIATKACILDKIMPDVVVAAGDSGNVISVNNGVGTEDKIAEYIDPARVCRMVVNYAGSVDENGKAKLTWFNPPNFFGPHAGEPNEKLVKLVEMLNSAGLTSEIVDSFTIKSKAFLKTILNSALMSICGVLGLTMREAMAGKITRSMAGELLKEGFSVANQLGYRYGDGIWGKCMGYLELGGDHHPSMSVDLQNKRPTEIEYISGKILELGRQFDGLNLEMTRIMVSLIMTMEVQNGTRKPDEFPDYLFKS